MKQQLNEIDYLKTWGLFALCATIGGFIAGALVGAILGGVLGGAGASLKTIKVVCGTAGFIVGLPISYLFFRLFVSRFIVHKLSGQTGSDAPQTLS
jgi:ABC-type uncharacterized transport system permease subunit